VKLFTLNALTPHFIGSSATGKSLRTDHGPNIAIDFRDLRPLGFLRTCVVDLLPRLASALSALKEI